MLFDDRYIQHMFRRHDGHVRDTPENRELLRATVAEPFRLGTDRYGNTWYARQLNDGRQVWASVRGGILRNGGINEVPHPFSDVTGLSKEKRDG